VGSLVLVVAIGADEDRGHHGERTEGGGDHVAHDVAIVVLASPDEAALAAYYAGNSVVDEGVEILQASLLELLLVALLIDLVEDDAELSVVLLGDRVLGSEPEILVDVERVGEASVSEGTDRLIDVVHALDDARAVELVDNNLFLLAALALEDELGNASLFAAHLYAFIDVAIGVTGDGDGLLPRANLRLDARQLDRSAEHRTIEDGTNRAVGALPHLVELVLVHALVVRSDRGALHGYAILLVGVGSVDRHLVVGLVAIGKTEVVVLALEVNERKDQLVLDHLPQNSGHLITVHLNDRGGHLNFFHCFVGIYFFISN